MDYDLNQPQLNHVNGLSLSAWFDFGRSLGRLSTHSIYIPMTGLAEFSNATLCCQ